MKNTRVLLILALAIISGLGAGYSALQYLDDRPGPLMAAGTNDLETQPVVLASRDLPLGKVLEEADLVVVEWPAQTVPAGFASSQQELVGRSLIADIRPERIYHLASKPMRPCWPRNWPIPDSTASSPSSRRACGP